MLLSPVARRKGVFSSAICFRMNNNNSQIGNTASEPSISYSDSEASIGQLISPGIMTTSQPPMDHNMPNIIRSQPLLISDQSRVEILMRQRTSRRRRRRRRAQRRWQQRVQHQHQQLAHQIRYRQMVNQHFQQQQEHRYDQDEEGEAQQDRDRHNHTLRRSPTFYDLFAEVMNERLLEIYDWETLSPENQPEQAQLFQLESTAALEQPVLVHDDAEQSPPIHAFESSEEDEQQKTTQMAEECNPAPLSNIETNSTPNSFDSILSQIEQMEEYQDSDSSPGTSQQHAATTEPSSYSKKQTDH